MRRDEAIARLRATERALRAHGVKALYLFGSRARDEAVPDSDIDVFVDPASAEFGFIPFTQAYETIREAIGHDIEVGYSTREGLDHYVRADIEREAVRVF
jgi:uncharacterized protein